MNMQSVVNTLDVYQSVVGESQGEYLWENIESGKFQLRNIYSEMSPTDRINS